MSSAAKKIPEDQPIDAGELTADRELKLAKNFEDPALEELIPGLGQPSATSVLEEAADAVHELVQEAAGGEPAPLDLSGALPIPGEDPKPAPLPTTTNPNPDLLERSLLMAAPGVGEASSVVSVDGFTADVNLDSGLYAMSCALFELVACERTFDDVVEAGLRAVVQGLHAQAGSVLELDHEHEDFFFRASVGGSTGEKLKAFRVPFNKGIVGHVAESGQPLLVRDLSEDQMQMRAISLSVGFEARSCMAAPILVGGQPYGVIEIFNRLDGGLFEEKDLRNLESGVRMLSKALEVRFLLAELSRRQG